MSIRRGRELSQVVESISEGTRVVHISGEPGIGKTTFLDLLGKEFGAKTVVHRFSLLHREGQDHLVGKVYDKLSGEPKGFDKLRYWWSGLSLSTPGSWGVSIAFDKPATLDPFQKLRNLGEYLPEDERYLFLIDDIHHVYDGSESLTTALEALADALPSNVHFLTAGRTPLGSTHRPERIDEIELPCFTEEQTKRYLLRRFEGMSGETASQVHNRLAGHPFYIAIFAESTEDPVNPQLPKEDLYRNLREMYLETLTAQEERFLIRTSPLLDLDEDLVGWVLPNCDGAEARVLLNDLREKTVVREIPRGPADEPAYKVHDAFRKYLHERGDDHHDVRRRAFQYYARPFLRADEYDREWLMQNLPSALLARAHLEALYDTTLSAEAVREEISRTEVEESEKFGSSLFLGFFLLEDDAEIRRLVELELDDAESSVSSQERFSDHEKDFILLIFDWFRGIIQASGENPNLGEASETFKDVRSRAREIEEISDEGGNIHFRWVADSVCFATHATMLAATRGTEEAPPHRNECLAILEDYGLPKSISEEFIDEVTSLVEATDIGNVIETRLNEILEETLNELTVGGVTRRAIYDLPTTLQARAEDTAPEVIEIVEDGGDFSERLLTCGDLLEEAPNPVFAYWWYSLLLLLWEQHGRGRHRIKAAKGRRRTERKRRSFEAGERETVWNLEGTLSVPEFVAPLMGDQDAK